MRAWGFVEVSALCRALVLAAVFVLAGCDAMWYADFEFPNRPAESKEEALLETGFGGSVTRQYMNLKDALKNESLITGGTKESPANRITVLKNLTSQGNYGVVFNTLDLQDKHVFITSKGGAKTITADAFNAGIKLTCASATGSIKFSNIKFERAYLDVNTGPGGYGGKIYVTFEDKTTFVEPKESLKFCNSSFFTMNGGEIFGAADSGVFIDNSSFTMKGGKIYRNSTPNSGGGVALGGSANFTMTGGEIYNNTAYSGGGVAIIDKYSTFTMNGGSIYNNKADHIGGGVYIDYASKFIFTGGVIYGADEDAALQNRANQYISCFLESGAVIKIHNDPEQTGTIGLEDTLR